MSKELLNKVGRVILKEWHDGCIAEDAEVKIELDMSWSGCCGDCGSESPEVTISSGEYTRYFDRYEFEEFFMKALEIASKL